MSRILCFIDSLGAGGAQRQLVGLAKMLKQEGEQVKVITYYDAPFYLSVLNENSVDYENIAKARNKFWRLYYIYKTIKLYKPDWIIAYIDTPCILACIYKLLGEKFKLLVSERNTTQKLTWREKIKFLLYHVADVVVPNSYSQERFILENHLVLPRKVKTITNFVDIDYFKNNKEKKRGKRGRIIVVATIWPSKNTLGFIDAMKLLRDSGEQFIVEWYGKSSSFLEYFDKCQQKIQEYHLEDYVKLKEKLKDIKDAYLEADYFCLPSFYEGTPNALCEAISCGLPVICSDVCDNSLYVHEGENGFLFNPCSPQEMKDKISQLLAIDDRTYSIYCSKSRQIAEELLSEKEFFSKYKMILK